MTDIKSWQEAHNAFYCEGMKARITEVACQQNQAQARKYQRNRYRSSDWGATGRGGGNYNAYGHCSHCARSSIKYTPDKYLVKNTTACAADEPDYWEEHGGR